MFWMPFGALIKWVKVEVFLSILLFIFDYYLRMHTVKHFFTLKTFPLATKDLF